MGVPVSKELKEEGALGTCTRDTREAAKRTLRELSKRVEKNGLYQVPLHGQQAFDLGTNHLFVGAHSFAPTKVILLMGKTGAGKTTIANWLLNYVYGVEFEDGYRFQLIEQGTAVTSDTNRVTSYTIYHQPGMRIPYSLTIVDTPGFQSTDGLEADKHIRKQLVEYFAGVPVADDEVDITQSINAVGVLVTASTQKLTASEEYVFDCIKQVFGVDIKENISILFTFSDQCEPRAKKVVDKAEVPYTAAFTFNNGDVLKVPDTDGTERYNTLSKLWWEAREEQTQKFFTTLDTMPAKTSKLTRKTLGEREKVERAVSNLELQVQSKLNELQTLDAMQNVVRENAKKINRKEPFNFFVCMESLVKVTLADSSYATNCQTCHFTCHEQCRTIDSRSRSGCLAMTLDGMCTVCPGKCSHTNHTTDKYVYKRKLEPVEKSSERMLMEEIGVAFDDITTSPSRSERVLKHLEDPLKKGALQNIAEIVKEIRESLETLNKVALARVPQDASEYIEVLIRREASRGEHGYQNRIQVLQDEQNKQQLVKLINSARRPSCDSEGQ